MGLLITAALASVLALGFDQSSIASIGSVIALLVFALMTLGHFRLRAETRVKIWVLCAALLSTVAVLATFIFTTLVNEPTAMITMGVILLASVALDLAWKRNQRPQPALSGADAESAPKEAAPQI